MEGHFSKVEQERGDLAGELEVPLQSPSWQIQEAVE